MHKIMSGRGPVGGKKSYRDKYEFDLIKVGDALVIDTAETDKVEIKRVLSNLRSYAVHYKKVFRIRREGADVIAWREA